jgi:hypothetical protein
LDFTALTNINPYSTGSAAAVRYGKKKRSVDPERN